MHGHRIKICSVDEMRKIDEEATKYGVDHFVLMENAGSAIYHLIASEIGVLNKKFLVIAGTGNNGGDALVVARRLYSAGGVVEVIIIGDPGKYREPARRNYEIAREMNIPMTTISSEADIGLLEKSIRDSDVVVVGLIGIGLKGEISGLMRKAVELINNLGTGKIIISVDIPTGINGDNGKVCGVAIKSTYTVTFGMPKYGNVLYPGYQYCGKLYVSRLSYPPQLLDSDEIRTELNTPVKPPERVKWGHKGMFGKFLAIAGSRYYYGAPYFVSYSFLKAGGGYSRLAAPKSVVPYIAAKCNEVVYHPMEETDDGTLALRNMDKIMSIIEEHGVDIVALGPGVSLNQETQELVVNLVEAIQRPLIIDGDGLTAISRNPSVLKKKKTPIVLTPHLGEFSRITGLNIGEIQENPIGVLRKTAMELGIYIVLKGAHSLIAYPNGYIYVNMTGNPGMAKAGSGDILTGTIAAMYGIGFRDMGTAVRMGVLVHGLAGDLAAEEKGEDGITPSDILEYLPRAIRILRENPYYVIDKYMPRYI
ncbi:MAG: NAD(P)H-hydrate dehydratase [Desulfurococcaceae archaeon]